MVSYKRIGSLVQADEIAVDPFGSIHLALSLSGGRFEQHWIVRTFSEEWLEAGLSYRLRKAGGLDLGAESGCIFEGGKVPSIASMDIPGQSLAQTLAKAQQEHFPVGVDLAISILCSLAEATLDLHLAGTSHGALTPHSLWLNYEGTAHLLDAPYASILASLLPKVPQASQAIACYLPPSSAAPVTPLQRDLYALGAILYEMLTFQKLPEQGVAAAVATGRLSASQSDDAFPPSIQALLERLLLLTKPYNSAAEFQQDLDSVTLDDDHAPSTFNTAYFLHTLFRAEYRASAQAREINKVADFTPFISTDAPPQTALQKPDYSTLIRWGILGSLGTAALVAGGVYIFQSKKRESEQYRSQVSLLQRELAQSNMAIADIHAQETSSQNREAELLRQEAEAKSAQEKLSIQKRIEEEKLKAAEIAHQKEVLLRSQQDLTTRSQAVIKAEPTAHLETVVQKATSATSALVPAIPHPPGAVSTPPPAAAPPSVSATPTATPAPTPARSEVLTPPALIHRVPPVMPFLRNPLTLDWLRIRNRDVHITAKVRVDQAGRVLTVLVQDSEGKLAEFEAAARNAAMSSTFEPAKQDGKPVSGWCTIEYNFQKPWLKR